MFSISHTLLVGNLILLRVCVCVWVGQWRTDHSCCCLRFSKSHAESAGVPQNVKRNQKERVCLIFPPPPQLPPFHLTFSCYHSLLSFTVFPSFLSSFLPSSLHCICPLLIYLPALTHSFTESSSSPSSSIIRLFLDAYFKPAFHSPLLLVTPPRPQPTYFLSVVKWNDHLLSALHTRTRNSRGHVGEVRSVFKRS